MLSEILDQCLPRQSENLSESGLKGSNVIIGITPVDIDNLEFKRLVLLKVEVHDEGPFIVRVQVVVDHLCLIDLRPFRALLVVILSVESDQSVRFSHIVDVNKIAAGHKELYLQSREVCRHYALV